LRNESFEHLASEQGEKVLHWVLLLKRLGCEAIEALCRHSEAVVVQTARGRLEDASVFLALWVLHSGVPN
jgi:hypothetical protein